MNKKNPIVLAFVVLAILAAGALPALGAFQKTQLALRAGYGLFQANGDNMDYAAGENDFPVTPAYSVPVAGIGLSFFASRTFAVGVNVQYALATGVDLRDPSDGETIQADTPKSLLAILSLCKTLELSRQLQLLVSVGGGGEYRLADDVEFTSNLGNRIVLPAPEKPFSALAAAGIGLQYALSGSLGLAVEFQGAYIFREKAQLLLIPSLALVLKF